MLEIRHRSSLEGAWPAPPGHRLRSTAYYMASQNWISLLAGPGRIPRWFLIVILTACLQSFFAQPVAAKANQRWVTDQFEITMRTGRDSKKTIVRVLPTGAQLELLKDDSDSGYSLVRTQGGTEGWVLNRYLMKRPPARTLLPELEARLKKSQESRAPLDREIRDLRAERADLQNTNSDLKASVAGLKRELSEVRRLSSSVLEVNDQNEQLRARLIENERTLDKVMMENRRLASRSSREWFVIGALVVIFGILIGLILPRIRWRKKSGWGDL
jgi:SH3 domain protein